MSSGPTLAVRLLGPVEADVRVILDRLAAPNVPAEEKHHIRDLLRYLARRPVRRAG